MPYVPHPREKGTSAEQRAVTEEQRGRNSKGSANRDSKKKTPLLKLNESWGASLIRKYAEAYKKELESEKAAAPETAYRVQVVEMVKDFIRVTNRIRTPATLREFVSKLHSGEGILIAKAMNDFTRECNTEGPLAMYRILREAAHTFIPEQYRRMQTDFYRPYYFIKISPFQVFWTNVDEYKFGFGLEIKGASYFTEIEEVYEMIKP